MIEQDKVEYIRTHPNESASSIARRLHINWKTVQRYKRKFGFIPMHSPRSKTYPQCQNRPFCCFDCPYADCILGSGIEETADELNFLSIGIPTVRSKKNDEATGS